MANSQAAVSALYAKVVTDVIAKSREEFLGEGLDASVLEELRVRWERKLAQSGVAPAPAAAAAAAPALAPVAKAPAKAPTRKKAPAAAPPPAVAPAAAAAPAPPPAAAPPVPAAPAAPPPPPPQAARDEPLALLGRPLAFLPAAAGWLTDLDAPAPPPLALPHAAAEPTQAHEDGGRKRKAPDSAVDVVAAGPGSQMQLVPAPSPPRPVPVPNAPAVALPAPEAAGSPDDGAELLSDSDDERDPETKNLVLSQFEKVTHAKNKWKCILKSGVMTLNGKDCVFNSATGDFSW